MLMKNILYTFIISMNKVEEYDALDCDLVFENSPESMQLEAGTSRRSLSI